MNDASGNATGAKGSASFHTSPAMEEVRDREVRDDVEHLHGPVEVACRPDDLVLVCLVRDGQPWVRDFLEYHFSLGVRHIALLDNDSTDDTVAIAKEYDNVTVLRTRLPFKTHKHATRRYLIRRFGEGRWVLCLDIDEMFDYPYSDIVGLGSLIEYLKRKSYTALPTQTLDRFPEKPLLSAAEDSDKPLGEVHRFYDLSNVREQSYGQNHRTNNLISNEEIKILRGGIQASISGHPAILTRHPLMFVDEDIEPMNADVHWVDKARIADFTGVIHHYRFVSDLRERAVRFAREEGHGTNSAKYKGFLQALEKSPDLQIKRETSKELESVNDLVHEGFLTVSESYMAWVDRAEEESPARETLRQRPFRLAEAFSKARTRREASTEAARQIKGRVRDLENEILEEQRKAERLERHNHNMESQLRGLQNSRTWRVLVGLARIRKRLVESLTSKRGSGQALPLRALSRLKVMASSGTTHHEQSRERRGEREGRTAGMKGRGNSEQQAVGRERGPKWYDESFENNEHWRQHYTQSRYYPLWAVISDRITRSGAKSVLDVGCGSGQLASLLRDKGLSHYLGFDFSPSRIEWAKNICPEFDFLVADALETSLFHTHYYDAVVSTEFLEHVERDIEIIEKVSAGSLFYASVPNFPYKSHVRHFESTEQIHQRYSEYFERFRVDVFPTGKQGRVFYVLEGIKR